MEFPKKPNEIYFFGTCLVDVFNPDIGMSAIQLIEREGVQVIFPHDQTCCGQPPFNSGYRNEAQKVALQQVNLFSKNIPVVVPSGSCGAMMRHHYLELFQNHQDLEKVRAFSERIIEFSQFLVHVLQIKFKDKGSPINVTWHASCHASREMCVKSEPKQLLKQLKNVNLVELDEEYECCGFGGTFSVKYPAISEAMLEDKIKDIEKTQSQKVLSGDCGCLIHIDGGIRHQNKPIQGQHLASFLWERTNA